MVAKLVIIIFLSINISIVDAQIDNKEYLLVPNIVNLNCYDEGCFKFIVEEPLNNFSFELYSKSGEKIGGISLKLISNGNILRQLLYEIVKKSERNPLFYYISFTVNEIVIEKSHYIDVL